jgi:hypothetical protein
MRSVSNIVAGLTPEEVERHRDLIDECCMREKNIQVWSARSHRAAALDKSGALANALLGLRDSSRQTLDVVSDAALDVSLASFNMWCERKRRS